MTTGPVSVFHPRLEHQLWIARAAQSCTLSRIEAASLAELEVFVRLGSRNDVEKALSDCLLAIAKAIRSVGQLPSSSWLVLADDVWPPDSGVLRHQSTSRRIASDFFSDLRYKEVLTLVHQHHGQIRRVGAARVDLVSSSDRLAWLLAARNCSCLLVEPACGEYDTLSLSWVCEALFPRERQMNDAGIAWCVAVERICARGYLVLRPFGQFDDPEWGFRVVGKRADLIRMLSCHVI